MSKAQSKRPNQGRTTRRTPAVIDLAAGEMRDDTPPQPAPDERAADTGGVERTLARTAQDSATTNTSSQSDAIQTPDNIPPDSIPPGPEADAPQKPRASTVTAEPSASSLDEHNSFQPPRRSVFGGFVLASFIGAILGGAATFAAIAYMGVGGIGGDGRIADLQKNVARLDDATRAVAPAVAASEARLRSGLASTQALANAQEQVTTLGRRLALLEQNPPSAAATDQSSLLAAIESTRALTQDAQAKASAALDTARSGASLTSRADARLTALEQTIKNAPGAASARLTLATRLSDALAMGRPLTGELSALSALGVLPDALAPLSAIGPDGVGNASLSASFRPIAADLRTRESASPTPAATTWYDRIWQWGSALVRVRKVDPDLNQRIVTIAAIEAALVAGRPREALRLWQTLPDVLRTTPSATAWTTRLSARARADEAIETISSEAITALATGPR